MILILENKMGLGSVGGFGNARDLGYVNGCGRADDVGDVRGAGNVDDFGSKGFCCKSRCVIAM